MATNQGDLISEEAFLARMNNYTAPDPSPRNPQISTHSSHADRVEANYQADGHKTWGFVIYRTTYDSDEDWSEFMRRLHAWTSENMDFYGGQDVLDQMTWTIFDDREEFNELDTSAIRRHFRNWAQTACPNEQQPAPSTGPVAPGRSPRYRYCLQIDTASLKSCVNDAPAPPDFSADSQGWVKVIDANWTPPRNDEDGDYEPIEGVREKDVGWMKCPFPSVMTEWYMLLNDLNGWRNCYRRPPAVSGYPWN